MPFHQQFSAARAAFVATALAFAAGTTQAEPVYGIRVTAPGTGANPTLIAFDSATPNTFTTVGAISGLNTGHTLRAIDFRPSNGLLYGLSTGTGGAQLYTVNLLTGALTTVGSGLVLPGNSSFIVSIDFNPVADALRVITGTGQNYRVNANTGALIAQDTSITGGSSMSDIAYNNNVVGAASTTLYGYDNTGDQLVTINPPNAGTTTNVGSSGVSSLDNIDMGFDISGLTGIAYASLDDASTPNSNSEFYTVNLATGAHSLVASLNYILLDFSVAPRAAIPEPESIALLGLGLAALAATSRRRRAVPSGR